MNKNVLIILVLALTATFVNSCKKGDEDPFISFRSRKARVEGLWNFDIYTKNTVSVYTEQDNPRTEIYSEEIGGEDANSDEMVTSTETKTLADSKTVKGLGTVTEYTVNFTGSNQFKMTKIYTLKSTFSEVTDTTSDNYVTKSYVRIENVTIKYKGTWNFLDKIKDEYKNKERIALDFTEISVTTDISTDTTEVTVDKTVIPAEELSRVESSSALTRTDIDNYATGENIQSWQLLRLANDEIKVVREIYDANSINLTASLDHSVVGTYNDAVKVTGEETFTLHLKGDAEEVTP